MAVEGEGEAGLRIDENEASGLKLMTMEMMITWLDLRRMDGGVEK